MDVKTFTKSEMPVTAKLIPPELRPIFEKVVAGERVTRDDGERLYESNDLNALGAIANTIRERKNGNVATYIHNQYINYSNLCLLSCQFCAFGARKRDAHAFELTIEEIVEKVRFALGLGITEIHMVGGLHPTLKGEWYLELLSRLRALDANLFIKAFTAIEIRHLAERVFQAADPRDARATPRGRARRDHRRRRGDFRPRRARPDLPRQGERRGVAGGASHLARDGHAQHGDDAFRAHRDATRIGSITCDACASCRMKRTASPASSPSAFEAEHARPSLHHIRHATAFEELQNLAVSRIYLDNFDHITGYWVSLGLPLASLALNYGVDDLHGTIMEEKIFHMAGAKTPTQQT